MCAVCVCVQIGIPTVTFLETFVQPVKLAACKLAMVFTRTMRCCGLCLNFVLAEMEHNAFPVVQCIIKMIFLVVALGSWL